MPLPVPRNNEKRGDFVSRCVSNLTDKDEFNDNKQRVAVCINIFEQAESKASVVTGEGDEKSLYFSDAANENKTLNKPFRTPKGPKKFSVYVKNKKGNVIKVNFGDPNMEIKRDDPKRRKAFRDRHNCDQAKDKTTPKYWSCKMWESGKSVTQVTKGSVEEWDGKTFFDHNSLVEECPALLDLAEGAKRPGPKSGAQTPAEPSERKRGSKRNPKGSAKKGGGKITFSEKTTNTLKDKVKKHNAKFSRKVTLGQLKRVYRRGAGAFSSSHRPNMSRHGWAMARVNTFLKMMRGGKVKESYRKADQDIAKSSMVKDGQYEGRRKTSEAAMKKKVYGMDMDDDEKTVFKSYMSHCVMNDADMVDTKDMDMDKTMSSCAVQYKKDRAMVMEKNEENKAQLTEKQKKLPPALKKAILEKMRKDGKITEEEEKEESEARHYKDKKKSEGQKKKYSYGAPDVNKHYFKTKEEAMKDAKKLGFDGIHTHKTEDGETLYMAGPNHEAFMKRHKQVMKEKEMEKDQKKKSDSSLWENIRKKRERIKRGSGEKMRKKGDKGAPTADQIQRAKGKNKK